MKHCSSHSYGRLSYVLTAVAMLFAIVTCASQAFAQKPTEDTDTAKSQAKDRVEYFEKHVRPLLIDHCYECHSDKKISGGLNLESPSKTRAGGDSGVALKPGHADDSLIVQAVRYSDPNLQMPPKQALQPVLVAVLEKWIADGAIDPRTEPSPNVGGGSPKPTGMSIEDGRNFWSLQPLSDTKPPSIQNTEWISNPIDLFIAARLEQAGLLPAPTASKSELIRRVTFDLTGLPPSPEAVEAFVSDTDPNAYGKLVDRLLASPQYGVRWGRHWLDVARYADSNGLDENLAFGNAWRYRDYVVDSFNSGKPYDRFLSEQIAGDLLPDASIETRVATGFLVLGAKVLAEPDRTKLEMDTIDEQIDTLGKAFLGMTWGCVRCHDHKFDPFKQDDYYSLAAIFKSTKTFGDGNFGAIKYWNEFAFATPEEKAALKKVDEEIAAKKAVASKYKAEAVAKIRSDARAKAADYLAAAIRLDMSSSLKQVAEVAGPLGLHPRILHHCRRHVEFHRDDALFKIWHEKKATGDSDGVRTHYAELFRATDAAWDEAKKKDATVKSLEDPLQEAARTALADAAGFLAVPPQAEFALSETELAEYHRLSEEARIVESNAADEPSAMAVEDRRITNELAVHIRGSHHNLGKVVDRNFPAVLVSTGRKPIFPRRESGRLQLAQWLASDSSPLTARVFVNRVWRWHMGVGLVATTDNFGTLGDKPSHPELLDWLARNFIEQDWQVKDLHRLILTSSMYRMSSHHSAEQQCAAIDPENRLLWKFRRVRLDAEQLRDSILAVGGNLDTKIGGKSVPLRNRQFVFDHTSIDHTKYDSLRRAVYLPVIRNNVYTWFEQFDFPDPTMPTGSRAETTVAPQALLMLNSELVMDAAQQMSRNLCAAYAADDQRIEAAFQACFARRPLQQEVDRLRRFLEERTRQSSPEDVADPMRSERELQAWSLLCQTLLSSNEFVFVR
ncbi:MAG: PSD1 and planctomycete cytochrome C domain-containing protein [Pirellulales bacterium]